MNLKEGLYELPFSHIYVEKEVWRYPRTKRILDRFPNSEKVEIDHYKDVFCRKKQNVALQNKVPNMILASRSSHMIYKGANVCQNFGNEHFYYTTCVMNCIYDCEYCYLKGMYPSGNLVIFVDLEDIFTELERILERHRIYLCISYDTDLMALEDLTGFVEEWILFASRHDDLMIEVRTKCGRTDLWDRFMPEKNVIFAFTLSPEGVREKYEHRTSSLKDRIICAEKAIEKGFMVRLCFDPIIYCPDWEQQYLEMLDLVGKGIDMSKITDVSVGSFRISQEYLKNLRRQMIDSAVVQFPFENEAGVCHYPKKLMEEMEKSVVSGLEKWMPQEKIFRWEGKYRK